MKALTFDTNSWHYRFVTSMTNYNPFYDDNDMCAYSSAFIKASLGLAVIGVLIAFFGHLLAHFLIGVVISLLMGTWFFTFVGEVMAFTLMLGAVVGILVATVWFGVDQLSTVKRRLSYSDSFVSNAYKSWKGKYCVKIEFKD